MGQLGKSTIVLRLNSNSHKEKNRKSNNYSSLDTRNVLMSRHNFESYLLIHRVQ